MAKIIVGMVLCFLIGVGCRWFDIPLPGPPKLVGVFLILSITVGYIAADKMIAMKFSSRGAASTRDLCAGPTGEVASNRLR